MDDLSVDKLRRELAVLGEMLDRVRQPIGLVDSAGSVLRSNRAFDAILQMDRKGPTPIPQGNQGLAGAVARSLEQGRTNSETFVIRRRGRRPVVFWVLCLPQPLEAGDGVAIVQAWDPDKCATDIQPALRAAYGLSPMEARLVQGLRDGLSLRTFAARHRMSYETARSHIRRIFLKTATRTQVEIVSLTLGIPAGG